MSERTGYTAGTFSWVDLATTDQEAAKRFYGELFGWEADDMPAGEGVTYSMMKKGGRYVAAIAPQPEQQARAGAPPAWNNYVTVDSADAAVEKAKELGGSAHAPAFDVFEAGRMAVLQDPHGAFFMVWEPKQHIGAQLVNEPGALCWNELATNDFDASKAFYGGLFGWSVDPMEGSPIPYQIIKTAAGTTNGGFRPPAPGEPPYWLAYFGIDEAGAGAERVEQLGGRKVAGPYDMGPGRIAIVQDPQGAWFALYSGHFDD